MDKALEERLLKYMDYVEGAAKGTADFVTEQAPDVVNQFLAWEFWYNVFLTAIWVTLTLTFYLIWRRNYPKTMAADAEAAEASHNAEPWRTVLLTAVCVCSGALFGIMGAVDACDALKVAVAPKVVLLEKIAELTTPQREAFRR